MNKELIEKITNNEDLTIDEKIDQVTLEIENEIFKGVPEDRKREIIRNSDRASRIHKTAN